MNRQAQPLCTAIAALGARRSAACGGDDGDGSGNPELASCAATRRPRRSTGAPPQLAAIRDQANELLDGGTDAFDERLDELRGHPVVVNKWASWCGPCRAEFPFFQSQARRARRRDRLPRRRLQRLRRRRRDLPRRAAAALPELPRPRPGDRQGVPRRPVEFPATAFYDSDGELAYVQPGRYATEAELAADIDALRPVADNQAGMTAQGDSPGAIAPWRSRPARPRSSRPPARARTSGTAYSIELQRHDRPRDRAGSRGARRAADDRRGAGDHPPRHARRARHSMREMVQDIIAAPMPVVVYVSPDGARAASAGLFVTQAADVAAMAPQTNIGSASPISVTGEDIGDGPRPQDRERRRRLRARARRGARPRRDLAEEMVTDAVNVTADRGARRRPDRHRRLRRATTCSRSSTASGSRARRRRRWTPQGLEIEEHDMPLQYDLLEDHRQPDRRLPAAARRPDRARDRGLQPRA